MSNEPDKISKDAFLDQHFVDRLQELVRLIQQPETKNREDHLSHVYDMLMLISDEYQSVMLEKENAYWLSIEMWKDECRQQDALTWVKKLIVSEPPAE